MDHDTYDPFVAMGAARVHQDHFSWARVSAWWCSATHPYRKEVATSTGCRAAGCCSGVGGGLE